MAARLGELLDSGTPVLGTRIQCLVDNMRVRRDALKERIANLDAEFADAAQADE